MIKSTTQIHNRFVNIVRFSPDGELFCTGSADCTAVARGLRRLALLEETRPTLEEFTVCVVRPSSCVSGSS